MARIKPGTSYMQSVCSTTELHPLLLVIVHSYLCWSCHQFARPIYILRYQSSFPCMDSIFPTLLLLGIVCVFLDIRKTLLWCSKMYLSSVSFFVFILRRTFSPQYQMYIPYYIFYFPFLPFFLNSNGLNLTDNIFSSWHTIITGPCRVLDFYFLFSLLSSTFSGISLSNHIHLL